MIYRAMIQGICGPAADPQIVEAMVLQESGGNPWAWNPEPAYRYLWNVKTKTPFRQMSSDEVRSKVPPPDFPYLGGDRDQEWLAQQASWGLLQVMGALARERGFARTYLTELCDPGTGLRVGIEYYQHLLTWSQNDPWKAVAAYNGGKGNWHGTAPQLHVTKVKRFHEQVKASY